MDVGQPNRIRMKNIQYRYYLKRRQIWGERQDYLKAKNEKTEQI